jgi:6-pyruvoyltetrahydropterin/6-carboxytetrahydropterin synthase
VIYVTREYSWSMGHRLQRHEGLCRNPHGHNYVAEVTVVGPVRSDDGSESGMVVDFGALDAIVKPIIDAWDHAFMVEDSDPFKKHLGAFGDECDVFPKIVVVPWAPTAEHIAARLFQLIYEARPSEAWHVCRVCVYETARSKAEAVL